MITVELAREYQLGSATIKKLDFREPRLKDLRRFGHVVEWQPTAKGDSLFMQDDVVLWQYADHLLQDVAPGALGELELDDALLVRRSIRDFFMAAESRSYRPTNSSSDSASTRVTSTP